jgi:predicted transcriptional regulator
MNADAEDTGRKLAFHAAKLVAAYVSNNSVVTGDLPGLITVLNVALSDLVAKVPVPIVAEPTRPTQDQVRNSITPDALISFLDGKPYKVLRRHLSVHGLTPMSYCTRFGLPPNYPMVAPSYSERRAAISTQMHLGKYKRS